MTNLDIRPGEQVALVGDNDSGKSRLAAAFAGSRNAKYITFRDSYGSYGDRNFFMQQRWNLFTLDWDPPTVDGRPLVTFSSGELRKYQLARALEGNPEVVVIDNPYIGLDPANRAYLTRHLTELSASTTFLLVLSRVAEIPPFITHVIPVENGLAGEKVSREAFLDATLPPAVIRMRNVTIRFGERVILDSLTWTVRKGEHWALTGANGWWYMRLGEDGPRLHDLRTQLQETKAENERERFRLAYWDGYYELCAESEAFVAAFGDPTERLQNPDCA